MTVSTWDSNAARLKWREVIDAAAAGADVVITRGGRPVVAVIAYADFLTLQDELDDLRAARRADAAYEEYLRDPSSARPWDEVRAELIADDKPDVDDRETPV